MIQIQILRNKFPNNSSMKKKKKIVDRCAGYTLSGRGPSACCGVDPRQRRFHGSSWRGGGGDRGERVGVGRRPPGGAAPGVAQRPHLEDPQCSRPIGEVGLRREHGMPSFSFHSFANSNGSNHDEWLVCAVQHDQGFVGQSSLLPYRCHDREEGQQLEEIRLYPRHLVVRLERVCS